jgi:hypothetical protein
MQGHLQKFDEAMLDLYRRLKKSLEEYAELELDIQARNNTIKVKDDMIKDYEAYKSVLALGIIDMADHLNWIMAGLKAEKAIRRPVLVEGERWQPGKKQILDLVIQFEGNLVKISTQRTLNIAYAAEIKKLKEPPTVTPLTPGDVANSLFQADNDKLTTELRTARTKIERLETEIAGLKDDALTAEGARITSHTEDDAYPDTSWTRTSDTVDSEKLHGLLLQLQHLVGPDFGDHKYFDVDSLTHDVVDIFKRDIPKESKKAFILALNEYASVEETDEISDTAFHYNLFSYLIGTRPRSKTSRRRRVQEEFATEGGGEDHISEDEGSAVLALPSPSLLPAASKELPVLKRGSDACMPILQLLTDLKLMHACM